MTLKEYLLLINSGNYKFNVPNRELIIKLYKKACAHTRGVDLSPLLHKYRTTENSESQRRRLELLEPITKPPFDEVLDDMRETIRPDLVKINISEEVKNAVNSDFWRFVMDDILTNMFDDPNGFVCVLPIATSIEGNTLPEFNIWVVNYEQIIDVGVDFIVFKKELNGYEFYYFVTKNEIGRFIISKEKYVIEEGYYSFFDFPRMPFFQLKGRIGKTKEGEKFWVSFFEAAFAHATKAVQVFSDREQTRMRANMLIVSRKRPCRNNCNDGLDEDGAKCGYCGGTGEEKISFNIGDMLTYSDDEIENLDIDKVVKFIDPPREAITMNNDLYKQHLNDCKEALRLIYVDQAQSGAAKEIDREKHTSMINSIAKNFYSLIRDVLQCLEWIFATNEVVTISLPDDFRQNKAALILEKINQLKAGGTTVGVLYPYYRKLYESLFIDDPISRKIAIFQLENDPLHTYPTVQEKRLSASDSIEFEKSKQMPQMLQKIAYSTEKDVFLKMSDEEIIKKLGEMFVLPKTQIQLPEA